MGPAFGNYLVRQFGALPWRFRTVEYQRALAAGMETVALEGRPAEANWDTALGGAMRTGGQAVLEEYMVDGLDGGPGLGLRGVNPICDCRTSQQNWGTSAAEGHGAQVPSTGRLRQAYPAW